MAVGVLVAAFALGAGQAHAAGYPEAVLADQPEAYWRLGEKSGTEAADASGKGHAAAYTAAVADRTRTGALVGDADSAVADARAWYSSAYDLVRIATANGLPGGASARTLEAWVWTDGGARIALYGDFGVTVEERAVVVAGKRFALSDDDDRSLTDARWHHVAVTYDGTALTAYLDGARLGEPQAVDAQHGDDRPVPGRTRSRPARPSAYDEIALYPRALDAAAVATHFTAAGSARPAAPANLVAQAADNRATLTWTAVTGDAPAGQRIVDHYLVETPAGSQSVDGARTTATLSGLPAGPTTVTVRAINGFGEGAAASVDVQIGGAAATYPSTVIADAPDLYWRLGEKSGARLADASGRGRAARYANPAEQRTRGGGLANETDGAVADGRAWYSSAYDLIRAPLATGLPGGASARTLEAWILSDAPGARPLVYGDFSFSVEERASPRRRQAVRARRRRRPAPDGLPLAPLRAHLRRRHAARLPRRRPAR